MVATVSVADCPKDDFGFVVKLGEERRAIYYHEGGICQERLVNVGGQPWWVIANDEEWDDLPGPPERQDGVNEDEIEV